MKILEHLTVIDDYVSKRQQRDQEKSMMSLGYLDPAIFGENEVPTADQDQRNWDIKEQKPLAEALYLCFAAICRQPGRKVFGFGRLIDELLDQELIGDPSSLTVQNINNKRIVSPVASLSGAQKLLLMYYFHFFCLFSDENLVTNPIIIEVRDVFGISDNFPAYFMQAMARAHYENWLSMDNLLDSIINAKNDFRKWAEDSVYGAIQEGGLIKKQKLFGLTRDDYEHPEDAAALNALAKIPGTETIVRKLNELSLDKLYRVQFTGSYLRITEKSYPRIYRPFLHACEVLEMDKRPELYMKQGFINAMTIGVEIPIVVINSASISLLNFDELSFLMGHELGHVKSDHLLYHQMAEVFPFLTSLLGPIGSMFSTGMQIALLNWHRKSEYTADRAGLLACQNIDAAVTTMMKLAGAPMKYFKALDPNDFISQARDFEGMDDDKINAVAKYLSIMLNDHPWTVMRASEMDNWVRSGSYDKVLSQRSHKNALVPRY